MLVDITKEFEHLTDTELLGINKELVQKSGTITMRTKFKKIDSSGDDEIMTALKEVLDTIHSVGKGINPKLIFDYMIVPLELRLIDVKVTTNEAFVIKLWDEAINEILGEIKDGTD